MIGGKGRWGSAGGVEVVFCSWGCCGKEKEVRMEGVMVLWVLIGCIGESSELGVSRLVSSMRCCCSHDGCLLGRWGNGVEASGSKAAWLGSFVSCST